jgi:hypothetical protein
MVSEIFTIVDQKNKEGEFLYEKIIKSPQFREGKDYIKERENVFRLLSYELKKFVLNKHSSSNNVGVISDTIYRVLIDKENSSHEEKDKNIGSSSSSFQQNSNLAKSIFITSSICLGLVFLISFVFYFKFRKNKIY